MKRTERKVKKIEELLREIDTLREDVVKKLPPSRFGLVYRHRGFECDDYRLTALFKTLKEVLHLKEFFEGERPELWEIYVVQIIDKPK